MLYISNCVQFLRTSRSVFRGHFLMLQIFRAYKTLITVINKSAYGTFQCFNYQHQLMGFYDCNQQNLCPFYRNSKACAHPIKWSVQSSLDLNDAIFEKRNYSTLLYYYTMNSWLEQSNAF